MKLEIYRRRPTSFLGLLLFGCAVASISFSLMGCSGDKANPAAEKSADAVSETDNKTAAPADGQSKQPAADAAASSQAKSVPAPTFVDVVNIETPYPNKKPKVRCSVKRYSDNSVVYHGPFASFYQSGEKFEEGNYVDGKKDGPWKLWYENGQLAKTENYANGQLEGQWSTLNNKGVKETDVSYKAGKRDGRWLTYGDDGKTVTKQEEYRDGKANGTVIASSTDGKKLAEMHFTDGQLDGSQQQWFPNGQLQQQAEFKNGKLNGKMIRWSEKGEKLSEEDYADGKLIPKADAKK